MDKATTLFEEAGKTVLFSWKEEIDVGALISIIGSWRSDLSQRDTSRIYLNVHKNYKTIK